MPSYQMNYLELADLIYAMDHFPPNTPRRWDTISEYMTVRRQLTANAVERIPRLDLDTDTTTGTHCAKRRRIQFAPSPKLCKDVGMYNTTEGGSLINSLISQRSPLYLNPSKNSTLKPLVLTPLRKECCGSSLIVRNRPCFPVVYTTNGTFLAANFHGKCQHCSMTYYCNRYESTTEQLEYFEPIESVTYFQTSTQTAFGVKYLEHVTTCWQFAMLHLSQLQGCTMQTMQLLITTTLEYL